MSHRFLDAGGRRCSRPLARLAVLACLALPGCMASSDAVATEENIVDGTLDSGDPSVFFLLRSDGYSCTCELISPHVVLTARHCVVNSTMEATANPGIFTLYAGRDPFRSSHRYRVSAVRIIPGSSSNINSGLAEDLGLLILSTPATETPYTVSRERPTMLRGQTITAVGFGMTPTGNRASQKYTTTGMVTMVQGDTVFVDPTVCEGDSGGPLIGPDGSVWGVASFIYSPDGMSQPVCGTAPGAYNGLYSHLAWIDSVLEEAGDICIMHPETCDGVDNDCNGVADEGCLVVGEPCTDASHCTSGHCEMTSGGQICTTLCDPTQIPALGCQDGYHCVDTGICNGVCNPGAPGTLGIGADCADDASCASGACVDPGDGRPRCLAPCFGDAGQCASGEVCTQADHACGACIPLDLFGSPHGLGEECTDDMQCRSGMCGSRDGVSECVTPCSGTSCPNGFVCLEGLCHLDRAQPPGGICDIDADCSSGTCAHAGAAGFCTPTTCDAGCPNGTACLDLGGGTMVCAPTLGLPGASCSSDGECASGSCFDGQCVTSCLEANDCGVGLRCVRTEDGSGGRCVHPPSTTPPSCGCAAAGTGSSARGLAWGLAALGLVLVARRRRPSEPRA